MIRQWKSVKGMLAVFLVVLSVLFSCPLPGHAFVGSLLRSVGRELVELCGRKAVREGGEKVVEEGVGIIGRKSLQEGAEEVGRLSLERGGAVIRNCGRAGAKAVELVGDDALRVAARYGREGVEMLARHSAAEARFLARHVDEAVAVWRRFGAEGTNLLVRYPGLTRPLLENCGRRGLLVAEKLSANNLARFNFISKKITREELDSLIRWVLRKGDDVMEFLWRHRFKLAAGGGLYVLLKDYDSGFETVELDAQGRPRKRIRTHSFFQHLVGRITDGTLRRYPWLPLAGLVGLLLWFWPWISRLWRLPRRLWKRTPESSASGSSREKVAVRE